MLLGRIEGWPLWCGIAMLITATVAFSRTGNVPNRLTYTAVFLAWVVAAIHSSGVLPLPMQGGILSSLSVTAISFIVVLPLYSFARVGGGCVKAQAALGAWLGCAAPTGDALVLGGAALLASAILTGIVALVRHIGHRKDSGVIAGWTFPLQLTASFGSIMGIAAVDLARAF
jgi:Flp pilus assembly protein protease CpaA